MAIDVVLPEVGEGIESGDVLEVFVNVGDVVEKEQMIAELETDKATVPVYSSHAGKVTEIHVKEGQTVAIGSVLISLQAAEATESAAPAEPPAAAEKPAPTAQEPAPAEPSQPTTSETAQQSQADQPDEAASPPDASQQPAVATGAQQQKAAAQEPAAQQPAAQQPAAQQPAAQQPAAQQPAKSSAKGKGDEDKGDVAAGPAAVRRFAREVGVDLTEVSGSGPQGRITREDVLEIVRSTNRSNKASSDGTLRDNWGTIRTERLSRMRKTIAANMHKSWSTVPRVTNFDDADVTDLESFRQSSKADYADKGIKLTSMPFVIKAVAMSLRNNPSINAIIDLENEQIVYKEYVNVGIAVDTERGLVVPVIRNADKMSIPEIAKSLQEVADKVRGGRFEISDTQGSSFTISNLGAIGGTYSTPIVNVPEVAILLVGRSRKMPVVINDELAIRLMMPLSLSYDHRLVDGAMAARFLNDIIGFLRAPSRLLLAP